MKGAATSMREQRLILLVDDDAYIRATLRRQLQGFGYRVVAVDGGHKALEAARSIRPDLIIMDVVMPGLNGLETCAQLKLDPALAETPLLFLSSICDIPTKVAGFELGAQDYMIKPVDERELGLRVRAALSNKIARDSLAEAANKLEIERRRLLEQACLDPLTGLPNRRTLMEEGARLLEQSRFRSQTFSLWMLDVDHFKKVNDTWGHAAGDQVLKLLASFMQTRFRQQALCARFGGEEFAVVLPGLSPASSAAAAELSRRVIERLTFPVADDLVIHVTVSVGAASFPNDGASLNELLELADQRLYMAKRSGRNRVEAGAPLYPVAESST